MSIRHLNARLWAHRTRRAGQTTEASAAAVGAHQEQELTPCRVLHIIGRMDRAGAETMLMNIYRELDRSRFQFDFLYFTEERCDYDDEIKALGGKIYRIPGRRAILRSIKLWRLLSIKKWSIVHSHTLFSSGLHLSVARIAAVRNRVAHAHSTQDANSTSTVGRAYQRLMLNLISWGATSRVACGRAAAQYLFPGRTDIVIVPNAIDIDRFAAASGARVRAEFGLADDCLTILHVGRLVPVKNQSLSLQIAAVLHERGINFRMLFAGTGADQRMIQHEIETRDLRESVTLIGLRSDIDELMAAADVLLLPSLYEGFPVVLVESQASGLPAVVSDTISSEVNLGLSLIVTVDLQTTAQRWADALSRASRCEIPNESIRKQSLLARGFSSEAGARMIESVYGAR